MLLKVKANTDPDVVLETERDTFSTTFLSCPRCSLASDEVHNFLGLPW